MFIPKGPYCQSCGMPLSKDPKGGGTEMDGDISKEYCSFCYQGGKFTEPNITLEQMVGKCKEKMLKMKIPRFVVNMGIKNIPKLKRWQSNKND